MSMVKLQTSDHQNLIYFGTVLKFSTFADVLKIAKDSLGTCDEFALGECLHFYNLFYELWEVVNCLNASTKTRFLDVDYTHMQYAYIKYYSPALSEGPINLALSVHTSTWNVIFLGWVHWFFFAWSKGSIILKKHDWVYFCEKICFYAQDGLN